MSIAQKSGATLSQANSFRTGRIDEAGEDVSSPMATDFLRPTQKMVPDALRAGPSSCSRGQSHAGD